MFCNFFENFVFITKNEPIENTLIKIRGYDKRNEQ